MATEFKSNCVSIIYNVSDDKRVGRVFAVKYGKETLFVVKKKSHMLESAYKTLEGAVTAFEREHGKKVVYSV